VGEITLFSYVLGTRAEAVMAFFSFFASRIFLGDPLFGNDTPNVARRAPQGDLFLKSGLQAAFFICMTEGSFFPLRIPVSFFLPVAPLLRKIGFFLLEPQ